MPIQFRCEHCDQLLSISSRKAGLTTVCPSCLEEVRIPGEPVADQATAEISRIDRDPSSPADGETFSEPSAAVGPAGAPASPEVKTASPARSSVSTVVRRRVDEEEDEEDEDWNPAKKQHTEKDAIDMTAMVDVTFLLLIFFMVTASFAAQKVMETSRPQDEQEEEGSGGGAVQAVASVDDLSESSVVVDIDEHDRMTIEGQPIEGMFALREVLSRKLLTEQKTELLIQAHYNALHGTVVSVTDIAMDIGMQRVRRVSRRDAP